MHACAWAYNSKMKTLKCSTNGGKAESITFMPLIPHLLLPSNHQKHSPVMSTSVRLCSLLSYSLRLCPTGSSCLLATSSKQRQPREKTSAGGGMEMVG